MVIRSSDVARNEHFTKEEFRLMMGVTRGVSAAQAVLRWNVQRGVVAGAYTRPLFSST
jgi:diketogulonate reductase-like aldo/keto reductase